MAVMKGEPLVKKLAMFAKYVVLPGAMAVALVYSPPDYAYYNIDDKSSKYRLSPSSSYSDRLIK